MAFSVWIAKLTPLAAGWISDLCFGDPAKLPHPVVWFGNAISALTQRLNKGSARMLKGALMSCFLIAAVFLLTWLLLRWLTLLSPVLSLLVQAFLIFFCLAGTTLRREVRMVFEAVDRSLDEGRRQVARIVGRDTQNLSGQEVRTAALETLAENLSDGVVAPLFWYVLAGLPGMLAYKMVNTLDSMIGYRNEKYRRFGCWAAHIDDMANYIPARLTALLMVIVSGRPRLLRFVARFGSCHASPNSGYPEAALAGYLDCRFGGPHDYFGELFVKPYIGTTEKQLTHGDMRRSLRLTLRAEILAVLLAEAVRIWWFPA